MEFDLDVELDQDVTLFFIEIKAIPLSLLASSYSHGDPKGEGKIGKHDYIVITALNRYDKPVSFVVEKLSKKKVQRGIFCGTYINVEAGAGSSSGALRYEADLKGMRVRLSVFKALLIARGWKYNIASENCWNYAFGTAGDVVNLCSSISRQGDEAGLQVSAANAASFEADLRKLKRVERTMPDALIRLILNPSSPRNKKILTRLKVNITEAMTTCVPCTLGGCCLTAHSLARWVFPTHFRRRTQQLPPVKFSF